MTRGQTVSVNTKKKYMPAAVSETGLEGGGAPGAAAVRRARGGAPGVGDPREQERDGAGGEDRGGTEATAEAGTGGVNNNNNNDNNSSNSSSNNNNNNNDRTRFRGVQGEHFGGLGTSGGTGGTPDF